MNYVLPVIKIVLLFTLTGLSLFRLAPRAIREIHSWVDRVILSLLTGIAFYTIFFLLAQGLLNFPLTETTLWGTFLMIILLGTGMEFWQRRRKGNPSEPPAKVFPSDKKKNLREITVFILLGILFFLALHIRLQNGLKYPDHLLDADPYRHHIRTEALLDTGHLSKYDPYLVGQVPIFELQGCYILAGVLGVAGPFSAWHLWMWGSQVFGALSIVSLYLFTKLSMRKLLERDLKTPEKLKNKSSPPQKSSTDPDTVGTFLGLIAAALLCASPVHILRTNAGFSEAYAIPLLAPTLLFYLWAAQSRVWGDFVWFGIFFSALAFINPVPAVFIVPFFLVHALYVLYHTRDFRFLWGNLLAGGIFFICLAVWNWKFLATPLLTGAQATSHAGTEGILKNFIKHPTFLEKIKAGWEVFTKEVFRNLGFFNLNGKLSRYLFGIFGILKPSTQKLYDLLVLLSAFGGAVWLLWDRVKRKWTFGVTTSFFFLSYAIFFIVLLLIPFGFISFTSKYYRYLLPISFSLSYLCAYFVWRVLLALTQNPRMQKMGLALVTLLAVVVGAEGRTWGGWVLNCTPEEYAAAKWINKNTQASDFIIANWYTGDYLRSLTKRRVIISDYPRIEVKVAKEKFNLDIPILPRNPRRVLDYTRDHPGTYYLVTAKWGPWGRYESDPHFELLRTLGENKKTQAKIYKISPVVPEPTPESQPQS